MSMIWLVIAFEIYPETNPIKTVSLEKVKKLVKEIWNVNIDNRMICQHLVSWYDSVRNPKNPKVGGSANRYLFRTKDGYNPHPHGKFRLYKQIDSKYDGKEKDGKIFPENDYLVTPEGKSAPKDLINWYKHQYFTK